MWGWLMLTMLATWGSMNVCKKIKRKEIIYQTSQLERERNLRTEQSDTKNSTVGTEVQRSTLQLMSVRVRDGICAAMHSQAGEGALSWLLVPGYAAHVVMPRPRPRHHALRAVPPAVRPPRPRLRIRRRDRPRRAQPGQQHAPRWEIQDPQRRRRKRRHLLPYSGIRSLDVMRRDPRRPPRHHQRTSSQTA
jgi:hypothetical protein